MLVVRLECIWKEAVTAYYIELPAWKNCGNPLNFCQESGFPD
jgi:hypothetical protein